MESPAHHRPVTPAAGGVADDNGTALLLELAFAADRRGAQDEARENYQALADLDPGAFFALSRLLTFDGIDGRLDDAETHHRALVAALAQADLARADWVHLMFVAYQSSIRALPPDVYGKVTRALDAAFAAAKTPLLPVNPRPATTRIRIGYLSTSLRDHPVGHVTAALFAAHDRTRFEVHAFYLPQGAHAAYTEQVRAGVERFHVLGGGTVDMANAIAAQQLDLLVYLDGYMSVGLLPVAALRPAAIQVFWLGHAGNCDLSFIDYFIADATVVPPGVGKTSLGQSIARATSRKFVRASLGGVHDEAEIRGHRRTYIGALPGKVIHGIHKAGTRNPVFMLDELDKLGASRHGDPSAALLEVLDPEQNATFQDNYLGVPFDLSAVMFVGTANVVDNIPAPLRDRMEVIELSGYTEEEKRQIARRYLVGRQLTATGLSAEQCEISDAALGTIIRDYTREAGCRNLERQIGAVFRHTAVRIAEGGTAAVRIDAGDIAAILGPPRYENEVAARTSVPGVATGLAWTPVGGDILFVEATSVLGAGKVTLTGQLGDVMKESAQTALSLVKTRAGALDLPADYFEKRDVHVHVPAGAIPKDGPSAGVAMFITLYSLLSAKAVRSDVAMTGEISLRGLVLPVGGIKEKVVAAARAGITTVLLPARNRKDYEDIPEAVRAQLKFVWLERVEDAVAAAFHDLPAIAAPAAA